jgi:hypothetical protein
MRSSRVVRASGCQCQSRNTPGFDPSILRHSGFRRAADEEVLNNVHKKEKNSDPDPDAFEMLNADPDSMIQDPQHLL